MSKSIKALALTTVCVAATSAECFAQTCAPTSGCGNLTTCVAVVAAVIAVGALILAFKAMRDSKRAMINATEEFQIMLESTKNSIDKDIKNLRREVRGKGGNNRKPNGESNGENADNKSDDDRRRNNNRRRQYRRPQQNEGGDNAAQPTETEE